MSSLTLVSLLGSIPLGALGWLATNFVARPILRAHELREKVWEELLVSANVSLFEAGLYERTAESLRRCAAQASALDVAWPSTLRWVLRLLRIDLREAAMGLLGFSNTFGRPNPDSAGFLRQAAASLRLPAEVIARPNDADDHKQARACA